jgi:hypothetical protein
MYSADTHGRGNVFYAIGIEECPWEPVEDHILELKALPDSIPNPTECPEVNITHDTDILSQRGEVEDVVEQVEEEPPERKA